VLGTEADPDQLRQGAGVRPKIANRGQ